MRYEVQDASGVWHPVDEVSAAAYRLDGVPVRPLAEDLIQEEEEE